MAILIPFYHKKKRIICFHALIYLRPVDLSGVFIGAVVSIGLFII